MLPPAALERRELVVENTSRRVVRISSHYPFDRVNPRLTFDRAQAAGYHLDLPAGSSERWSPGESKTVRLVRYAADPDRPGAGS
jgi:urease beta subunit